MAAIDINTVISAVTFFTNNTTNTTTPPLDYVAKVIGWLTFSIGLPAIGLAVYVMKNLVKGQNKVPIYIISLLVADVLSFFGRPEVGTTGVLPSGDMTTRLLFFFGIVSNVTFMTCIAQERHLLVAYPQCQGCFTTLKKNAIISMAVWGAPFAVLALAMLHYYFWFAVALLAPFPFLLFFALDSWRAIHCCPQSTPQTVERKRMALGLMVICSNYILLYLPFILSVLLESLSFQDEVRYLGLVSHLLLYFSPLVDPFLYLFMSQGPRAVLEVFPCCKKRVAEGPEPTVDTVSEIVETRL